MARGFDGHSPVDVTHHLKGVSFPAGKEDLLEAAKDNGAGRDILDMIDAMPDGEFRSITDVMKAFREQERR